MDKKQMTAVILAGGASSRMGQNKALMKLGDKTMIQRIVDTLRTSFEEIIIITDTPKEYDFLEEVKFATDALETQKKNSLLGIYSGLKVAHYPCIFVVACDMPFLDVDFIRHMIELYKGEDILIPYIKPHYEPLHAIYNKTCIPMMEEFLDKNHYKIIDMFDQLEVTEISKDEVKQFDPIMKCFINVNTKEEYLEISKNF